jgi:hypothetical protein
MAELIEIEVRRSFCSSLLRILQVTGCINNNVHKKRKASPVKYVLNPRDAFF